MLHYKLDSFASAAIAVRAESPPHQLAWCRMFSTTINAFIVDGRAAKPIHPRSNKSSAAPVMPTCSACICTAFMTCSSLHDDFAAVGMVEDGKVGGWA
jgi:hypothetical protein